MNVPAILGVVAFIVLWGVLAGLRIASPLLLPSPASVGKALFGLLLTGGGIWPELGLTAARTLTSFFLSCLAGIPLGLLMGFVPPVYRTLEVLVDFFRSIPPIALFPLFLLVLGIGEPAKVGVAFYGCSLVIIINSVYGVSNAPVLRRTVGVVYGLSRPQIFWKIVLPDALPQVFVGMRTALSLALVLTIVVEMTIGSENGLGKKIYDYHLVFDSPRMYAAIILTGLLGYGLNKTFRYLEGRVVHWADK